MTKRPSASTASCGTFASPCPTAPQLRMVIFQSACADDFSASTSTFVSLLVLRITSSAAS